MRRNGNAKAMGGGDANGTGSPSMRSRSKHRYCSITTFLACSMILLCFPAALYIAYTIKEETIWSTRTLAGDNLKPTPWHPFADAIENGEKNWEKLSRIQCTYLSCLLSSSSRISAMSSRNSSSAAPAAAPCPDFFQWIHEDLRPWRATGISKHSIKQAQKFAAFRITIVDGRLYTSLYYKCVQSRAMFTIWGLLLLLDRFPGQVPDVDFMFNCMDRPHFEKKDIGKSVVPPPLLAYCGSQSTFDIPFPDWSYWGWVETNIGPWGDESAAVFEGSHELEWAERRPSAFWKGNPHVGASVRTDLLTCNTSRVGAEIFIQDWNAEARDGYKNSKLSKQCTHRYKIYAEGHAWSVSFKYIMACGSTLLMVNPEYHDFFMRGLLPAYHYWPVDRHNLCPSIQNAVLWGNEHPREAEAIGNRAQEFLRKDLSMDHVYDYMLHFLQEYAKLQTFKPVVPEGSQQVCKSSILCLADPQQRKALEQTLRSNHGGDGTTMVTCAMPPRNHTAIVNFKKKELRGFKVVKDMETKSGLEKGVFLRSLVWDGGFSYPRNPAMTNMIGISQRLARHKVLISFVVIFVTFLLICLTETSRSFLENTRVAAWKSIFKDETSGLLDRPRFFDLDQTQRLELAKCSSFPGFNDNDDRNCPSYFSWIHEDLAPWNSTGIAPEIMEEAKRKADFRVVIVDGKVYYERYNKCFQTRDDYTLWGLLMLIETFPGMVPDVELYFGCGDHPRVLKADYKNSTPPPIFSYCTSTSGEHYDVVFPDWSYWGWPEVNIQPWKEEGGEIFTASGAKDWSDRQALAYWKGNIWVGTEVRKELLNCNSSHYNALIYHQDWGSETNNKFKSSSLSQQCNSRYKIYVQGNGWSVSLKYIMACGSTVLHIEPQFWEFFARSWLPFVHYWPVSRENMCNSIKYAVEWGNARPEQAAAIGKCGKAFVEKQVSMEYVYSYKLHLLQTYAKLQRFKPVAPQGVQALTLSSTLPWHELTMPRNGTAKSPCKMMPRDPSSIKTVLFSQSAGYETAKLYS